MPAPRLRSRSTRLIALGALAGAAALAPFLLPGSAAGAPPTFTPAARLPLEGLAADLAADGSRLCLAAGRLHVVDVTVPARPVLRASVDLVGMDLGGARGVAVRESFAYVATQTTPDANPRNALRVVDLSDPDHPAIAGSLPTPGTIPEGRIPVVVEGTRAYLCRPGLFAIEVGSPAAPRLIAAVPVRGLDLCVRGGIAYVAAEAGGLLVLDLRDPAAPATLAHWGNPDPEGNWFGARALFLAGERLLAAGTHRGEPRLLAFDVRDPTAPRLLGSCALPGRSAYALEVDGAHALASIEGLGLAAFALSGRQAPRLAARRPLPFARRLLRRDGTLYVAAWERGLEVFLLR
ncbi:MAG: LVIVD repeat-containing protein [Planctomycetaceae bacterium]